MIKDAHVFREDFILRDIVHRHSRISQLSKALEPIMEASTGSASKLLGPIGLGETGVAKSTTQKLQREYLDIQTTMSNSGWASLSTIEPDLDGPTENRIEAVRVAVVDFPYR